MTRRMLMTAVALCCGCFLQAQDRPGFRLEGETWTYAADGLSMSGILVKPDGTGPFPAIVISHGSGGNAGGFALTKAREMVKWGFVCIGTNYTFAGKPGARPAAAKKSPATPAQPLTPEQSAVRYPNPPGSAVTDRVENLKRGAKCIEILEGLPYVDAKRIALYGNSAGAIMTIAMSGAMPGKIAAAAMTAGGIGGRFVAPEIAEKIRCPFLIIHGSADPLVPPQTSLDLRAILDRNHVPNERKVFEGIGHNVHGDKRDEVFGLLREWFTKYGVLR